MTRYWPTIQKKFLLLLLLVGMIPAAIGMAMAVWGGRLAFASTMSASLESRAREMANLLDQLGEETQSTLAQAVRARGKDFEGLCRDAAAAGAEVALDFSPPADPQIVSLDLRRAGSNPRLAKLAPELAELAAGGKVGPEGWAGDVAFSETPTQTPGGWLSLAYPRPAGGLYMFLFRGDALVQKSRAALLNAGDVVQLWAARGYLLTTGEGPPELGDWARVSLREARSQVSGVANLTRQRDGRDSWHLVAHSRSRRLARLASEGRANGAWSTILSYDMELFIGPQSAWLWPRMGAVVVVWGALLTALSTLAARRIVGPVKSLRRQAEAMSAGDLYARASVRSRDEIQDLAEAFNRMADQLRERDRRITNFAHELEAKVVERTRDLARANQKLIQTEKHAATGRLVANLAHEINNPLGIIKNYLRLARDTLAESAGGGRRRTDPNAERLQIINEEIDRIARIVRQLLDLHRPPDQSVKETDVNLLLQSILALMEKSFGKERIEIRRELATGLPRVVVAPDQIHQVFLNLLRNAQDAMEGKGGTLTVRTEAREVAEDGARQQAVVVTISDTGSGISRENLDKIFDPFFTTKGPEKGTGLGLSVSFGVLQTYGGSIEAMSEEGKGTTMIVTLPLKRRLIVAPPTPPSGGPLV